MISLQIMLHVFEKPYGVQKSHPRFVIFYGELYLMFFLLAVGWFLGVYQSVVFAQFVWKKMKQYGMRWYPALLPDLSGIDRVFRLVCIWLIRFVIGGRFWLINTIIIIWQNQLCSPGASGRLEMHLCGLIVHLLLLLLCYRQEECLICITMLKCQSIVLCCCQNRI